MEMPGGLQSALNEQVSNISHENLMNAAKNISSRYRTRDNTAKKYYIQTQEEALAYAVSRMPATFGAVYKALNYAVSLIDLMDNSRRNISSLIDIGAGTGTAAWAAHELLDLDSIICVEHNDIMRELGQSMMLYGRDILKNAQWESFDIAADVFNYRADLVIASYVINELDENCWIETAEKLWAVTDNILLLVETGTPEGYRILNKIRERLLECNAYIIAPCPHENLCPLPENDWCHFICRVQRSKLHRMAKGGDAPYEDEKYSYLALSKHKISHRGARILRHPQIGKGHVKLDLCTQDGIKKSTYTKKDGDIYKRARKSDCGDII